MTTLDFKPNGIVVLHVRHGDVVVRGQPGRNSGHLIARAGGAPDQAPQVSQTEGETHLHTAGDVTLTLPAGTGCRLLGEAGDVVLRMLGEVGLEHCHGDLVGSDLAALQITGEVHGDAALRQITGSLSLERVHGDLAVASAGLVRVAAVEGDVSLSGVGEVYAGRIHGDLHASACRQALIKEIDGDAALVSITEAADLKRVSGNLAVTAPGRTLAAPEVGGDARLTGALLSEGTYWIGARGDVAARITGDVRVVVRAGGQVRLDPSATVENSENGLVRATLGQPERAAVLNIEAQGNVKINAPGKGDRAAAAGIDAEIRRAMAEMQKEMAHAAGVMGKEAGRAAGQVSAQMGAEIGASMRSLARDLFESVSPKPAPPPPPKTAGPSRDEMHAILDMLAAGKISAAEAENLIEALRG